MAGFIIGEKSGQSHMYTEGGVRIPVTTIATSPCYLIDIVPNPSDASVARSVRLGFKTTKHMDKPTRGQLTKAGITTPLRFLREIRLDKLGISAQIIEEDKTKSIQIGDVKISIGGEVKPSSFFKAGDMVQVTGTSKGMGFQGVVRRHGFAGGPKTHGQSDRLRAPGSIGQTTTPGRVYKGKRMAGRAGGATITIKNLEVVASDDQSLKIKGLVPGSVSSVVEVRAHA